MADNADGAPAPTLSGDAFQLIGDPGPTKTTTTTVTTPPTTTTTPAPAPRPAPPTGCSSRRKFTVSKSLSRSIRSGTATLNGKRIGRLSPRRRTITVDLRGRKPGTYVLRVTITTKKGKTVTITRRYKTCASKA